MARSAADQASDAADVVSAWLGQRQGAAAPDAAIPAPAGEADRGAPPDAVVPDAVDAGAAAALGDREEVPRHSAPSEHRHDGGASDAPLRLPHTDWLQHRLTISGPEGTVASFRAAAAGAGIIPWQLDLDALAEDWFLLLAAPPAPQQRTVSLAGARVLAGQLREAVAARQAAACARVGRSRACPFDLHALLPVPDAILRLGPDHSDALSWLWQRWGTTEALRHVAEDRDAAGGPLHAAAGEAVFRVDFWSADWTPWRALLHLRAAWPALRFDIRPSYDAAGADDR
jgi:hypothetical protein